MRTVLYGETHRMGTGAWCYAQALKSAGAEVYTFDNAHRLDTYIHGHVWRVWRRLRLETPFFYRRAHARDFVDSCIQHRPDLVIVLKGLYLTHSDLSKIRTETGAIILCINHDDYYSKNRNNRSRVQHAALPAYDGIFVTRRINVSEISKLARHVEFFPFAYEPTLHRPLWPQTELGKGVDLLFIGTHETERAGLMEALIRAGIDNLEIHGEGWERLPADSPLRSCVRSGGLWGDDMARAIGEAKISLGFLRKENRDEYTQRSFEIPACGGLLLAERTSSHLEFYAEGREAEFFDPAKPEELVTKAKELLSDPERRYKIRLGGMTALARQGHTYGHRINRLFQFVTEMRR